eukprot:TRINITY_DN511_c1_g1_i2.p1 TRINITY_DN511_c1_g1~~TRINITY_DN511_c1_g1_i2.p1  ORF type:complete len:158 (-),score=29.30 TRINITY_DN511_c1_g1_i2:24-497(-)
MEFEYGNGGSQVGIVATFSYQLHSFCIAATHLKAKLGFEQVRANQGTALINFINEYNRNNLPVVICGDFNDEPNSLVYNILKQRYTTIYSGEHQSWTTWKKRSTEVKRTIDYIWYQPNRIGVDAILNIPEDSECPDMLPAAYYPSDHLAIGAQIYFK